MSSDVAIRKAINSIPRGKAFFAKDFLHLGTRAAVDQMLYRMAKNEEVIRIARGIYVRPKWNKYVNGPVLPEPYEVAEIIARGRGVEIGPTGAEAVHRLGLSTQMPTQPVYATTGRSGEIKVGKNTIKFRHVSPRKMQYAGTPVGTAIAALRYLGKRQVTPQVIASIEKSLSKEDFKTLRQAATALPGWAMDKLFEYEAQCGNRLS